MRHQTVSSHELQLLAFAVEARIDINSEAEEASLVHRGTRYVADLSEPTTEDVAS